MKNLWITIILIAFISILNAQESTKNLVKIPAIDVKTMDGKSFNTSSIFK